MAHTTPRPVRRLLLAVLAGGSLAAGITAIAASPSTTSDPQSRSGTEESSRGEAGAGVAGLSATAEGIAITGADRMAASPSIVATSGRRVATEATVHAPGDLVTAHAVELYAAVIGGSTTSQAMVQHATYGRHDLGRLAVSCRNGVPTAERTGTVRLATNVLVDYGRSRGDRVTGATVLVLGPADRVTRIVRIATVSCGSPYQAGTAPPARIPMPSTRTGHLTVTG